MPVVDLKQKPGEEQMPPCRDPVGRLIGLHGKQFRSFDQLVGLIIGFLLRLTLGRHRGTFGRRLVVGFGAELIEARLGRGECRAEPLDDHLQFG